MIPPMPTTSFDGIISSQRPVVCVKAKVWDDQEENVQQEKNFEINNDDVTDRWIGRHGPDDRAYLQWPHRSPDIIPCDFSFGVL